MSISEFRARLLAALSTDFSAARVQVVEKRTIVLEARVWVEDDLFLDVYYNELTFKTSYALVHKGQRVFGYDNYRFWHCHPYGRSAEHTPCEEPEVDQVLAEASGVVQQLRRLELEDLDATG